MLLGVLVLRQVAHGRRLQTLAMTDELTRVANRRSFLGSAAERFALARRGDRPLALLAFDLDHFKHINDHHGHEVGDHVLQRVAQTARTTLRQADVVGRVGGEEFLALLPETDLSAARDAAERLRAAIEQLELADLAPGLAVAVSVGIAARQPGDPDFATLARRADEALYRAKEAGRNRVVAAPPSV